MARYRYLFYTWGGQFIDELPVQSPAPIWPISSAGQFSGQLPLFDPDLSRDRVLAATKPKCRKLFIERDGSLIWGGWITEPRTYDSSAKTITISAEQTVGYFASRYVPTLRLFGQDQVSIAQQVIGAMQDVPGGDAGMAVTALNGLSGVLRDGVYSKWDFTPGLQALTDLTEMESGLEFASRVTWRSGAPYEELLIAWPYLGRRRAASPLVIEFHKISGGNCTYYNWPDGPGLATRVWSSATTPDGVQLVARKDNTDLLDLGYPLIEVKADFTSSKPTTQAALQASANRQAGWADGERTAAQFTVMPSALFQIGDANPGDDVMVRITDDRFPAGPGGRPGFAGWMRIGQLQANPDQQGQETYTVTMLNYTEPV